MTTEALHCTQLVHHRLTVADPATSLAFYHRYFGLSLHATYETGGRRYYYLGFGLPRPDGDAAIPDYPGCLLELSHDPNDEFDTGPIDGAVPGYWKFSLAVADLDAARERLLAAGPDLSEPVMVPDVAYLCHCSDPDGYDIELIQHRFPANHPGSRYDPGYALGTPTSLSLVTYRVRDPVASLAFYQQQLGLRLLSKQVLEERGFTLYFLSADVEAAPDDDVESIGIREWLWQRPYALIELQHVHGTEVDPEYGYPIGHQTGFRGIRLLARDLASDGDIVTLPRLARRCQRLVDPDGYSIEVIEARDA